MMTKHLRSKRCRRYRYWMVSFFAGLFLLCNNFVLLPGLGPSSLNTDLGFHVKETKDTTNDMFFCDSLSLRSVPFNPQSYMLQGPGRSFLEDYENQLSQNSKRNKRLLKIRFLVYNLSSSSCRPIYYHIHKNGGSTMNVKMDMLDSSMMSAVSNVDAYYTPREQEMGWENFQNATTVIWHQIAKDQQQQGKRSMPIFSFLRDPVPRFLSSVGQALKLNHLGSCTKRHSIGGQRETLQLLHCILTEIQQKRRFLDEHLEPQIFELYHGTMGMNLTIDLMDLTSMDSVLQDLFGVSSLRLSRRQSKGLVLGFNLSMTLLTTEIISHICTVYSMDVLFLLQTRVTSTICEKYLTVNKSYH